MHGLSVSNSSPTLRTLDAFGILQSSQPGFGLPATIALVISNLCNGNKLVGLTFLESACGRQERGAMTKIKVVLFGSLNERTVQRFTYGLLMGEMPKAIW